MTREDATKILAAMAAYEAETCQRFEAMLIARDPDPFANRKEITNNRIRVKLSIKAIKHAIKVMDAYYDDKELEEEDGKEDDKPE
jgi:hypothetical protein